MDAMWQQDEVIVIEMEVKLILQLADKHDEVGGIWKKYELK